MNYMTIAQLYEAGFQHGYHAPTYPVKEASLLSGTRAAAYWQGFEDAKKPRTA